MTSIFPLSSNLSEAFYAPNLLLRHAANFLEHSISAETLKEVEDTAIPSLIKMQEKAASGRHRRRNAPLFLALRFHGMLDGLTLEERDEGVQFAGVKLRPIFPTITGKLDFPDDHQCRAF